MTIYNPAPTPTTGDPILANYLSIELANLAVAINGKPDFAYGGLNIVGLPASQQVGVTPVLYDPFNFTSPTNPSGILPDDTDGSLTVLTGGVFNLMFIANLVNLPVNGEFTFELFLNGAGTGLQFSVDPSNQTAQMFMVGAGLVTAVKGDKFQIFVFSDLDFRTLESQTSSFFMSRASLGVA